MADHERSTTVAAGPQAAFDWLANPANMPTYVATMTSARPAGSGLHVTADVAGRGLEEGDATFSADQSALRIEWGRAGSEYRGELAVDAEGSGSRVTLRLHTRDDSNAAQTEQALDETIGSIRSALG